MRQIPIVYIGQTDKHLTKTILNWLIIAGLLVTGAILGFVICLEIVGRINIDSSAFI